VEVGPWRVEFSHAALEDEAVRGDFRITTRGETDDS